MPATGRALSSTFKFFLGLVICVTPFALQSAGQTSNFQKDMAAAMQGNVDAELKVASAYQRGGISLTRRAAHWYAKAGGVGKSRGGSPVCGNAVPGPRHGKRRAEGLPVVPESSAGEGSGRDE